MYVGMYVSVPVCACARACAVGSASGRARTRDWNMKVTEPTPPPAGSAAASPPEADAEITARLSRDSLARVMEEMRTRDPRARLGRAPCLPDALRCYQVDSRERTASALARIPHASTQIGREATAKRWEPERGLTRTW